MGLDMYLNAERFFWHNEPKPVVEGIEVKSVEAEAAYWRKANHIHHWFVLNVQNGEDECNPHSVSRDKLRELVDVCKKVKAQHKLAPELLPTQSGFFFGGTDYDEYYLADLDRTIHQIEAALLKFPEDKWDFTYRSSW